jgi:mono/diheme cytochrome c family protein
MPRAASILLSWVTALAAHTQPHGQTFAGGLPFKAQFGTVYSTNITPDRATGIGGWTRNQFYRALHEGIAADGKHLYPAFPYAYFTRITHQDTDDLFAYLKTLKPVHQPPTPNKLIFPVNLRFGLIVWNWLYLDQKPPTIPANASRQWKRGEYLVNGLGHCAACHTPKTILFGDQTDRPLGGGVVDHWFANNLTGGPVQGLGKWSKDDVVSFLATGVSAHATAAGSMLEKVTSSTSKMMAEDRSAIATYLKSLPAHTSMAWERPRPEQMERGRGVFTAYCQRCHAIPESKAGCHGSISNRASTEMTLSSGPSVRSSTGAYRNASNSDRSCETEVGLINASPRTGSSVAATESLPT